MGNLRYIKKNAKTKEREKVAFFWKIKLRTVVLFLTPFETIAYVSAIHQTSKSLLAPDKQQKQANTACVS